MSTHTEKYPTFFIHESQGNAVLSLPVPHQIQYANLKISKIVKKCKACQLTNIVANEIPSTQYQSTKPRDYQEMIFTQVKPKIFRYRVLMMFTDTSSGWTETFPTKHGTVQMITRNLKKEILPRYIFSNFLGSEIRPTFLS